MVAFFSNPVFSQKPALFSLVPINRLFKKWALEEGSMAIGYYSNI